MRSESNESIELKDRYLLVDDKPLNWKGARNYCKNIGGYLATISSLNEQNIISQVAGNRIVWICLNDVDVEGQWIWILTHLFLVIIIGLKNLLNQMAKIVLQ